MKKEDNIAIGLRVKELRIARGITQEKLAEIVDCSPSYISVIESGKREMSLSLFLKTVKALHVEPNDLMVDVIQIKEYEDDIFYGCSAKERVAIEKTLKTMKEALRGLLEKD